MALAFIFGLHAAPLLAQATGAQATGTQTQGTTARSTTNPAPTKPATTQPATTHLATTAATGQATAGQGTTGQSTNVPAPATTSEPLQEVVITGYRKSLQDETDAKRASVGFEDSIFAEDIGQFPDTNIAESFNRVPGIQITRDANGEGVNVAIRGLSPDFTKVLLNGAPVAVASTGPIDAQDANREVDLNMFPPELFTQLTVQKSASADMLEGGASGTINMRSARPFDHPGPQLTYSVQGTNDENADGWGEHGSLLASDTWGPFGILAGYVGVHDLSRTTGYETIGYTTPELLGAQCPSGTTCNTTGGGNWSIPAVVPSNASTLAAGLVPGTAIDSSFLLAHNPGLTIQQINNAILPRLGRPMDEDGTRDRNNGVLSLEYRPTDDLHLYVDSMYGKEQNNLQRYDMDWVVRSGSAIPLDMTVDSSTCTTGCTVTSGTFPNSQFFLEYRPYIETTEFWGVNPGLDWQIADDWKADFKLNQTHSTFHRESPSVLAATASDVTVNYSDTGGVPSIGSSVDLDDPSNFMWNSAARVNIQDERRVTDTKGAHADATWGKGGPVNISFGAAYDDISRSIMAFDNSQAWQNAVCGDDPDPSLLAPNTEPPCLGAVTPTPGAGYPTYPGLGTGYTAGISPPLVYQGSLVPNISSFLVPGRNGFVTLNWPAFAAASEYAAFHAAEPPTTAANTGAAGGTIDEKTTGAYLQLEGLTLVSGNKLRYTLGLRYVRTVETVGAAISEVNPENAAIIDSELAAMGGSASSSADVAAATAAVEGSLFPNSVILNSFQQTYYNALPSGQVAYNVADNAVVKLAASKTMTRPDPSALLPGASFSDPSAEVGTLGNPDLKPYISENLDLGVEYYLGGPSYWALTTFRKRISGFTANNNITEPFTALSNYGISYATLTPTQQSALNLRCPEGTSSPDCTVVLTQQVNATGALTINGLEADYVQSLDNLFDRFGWGLHGFGWSFNFTLVDQFGSGSAPATALGVAPHSYNLSLYYETNALSLVLSTVYNAGSVQSTLNQNGIPLAAIYSDDYQEWDFSSYLDLAKVLDMTWTRKLQLTFDVTNIFDEHLRQYFEFNDAPYTDYDPGRTISVGVRGQF